MEPELLLLGILFLMAIQSFLLQILLRQMVLME